jgi:putative FmdB family regulatory protein
VEDPLPTYQYACTECGHAFEQFQSFTDDALTVCPQCQGRLRKVFNAVGVVFKGSGFYRTDSRTDGKSAVPASASTSKSDSSSGEKKSETRTESSSSTGSPAKSDSTSAA